MASLDFAYIDAQHHFEAIREDIELWYPKIRRGGILSGHDFLDGYAAGYLYGVESAGTEFASRNRLKAKLSGEGIRPSWFIVVK